MRWWEILVPLFVLVVGLNALPTPLDRGVYAFVGVLLSALGAWFSVVLVRRCKFLEFCKRLRSQAHSAS